MPCPGRSTVRNNFIQAERTQSSRGMSSATKYPQR